VNPDVVVIGAGIVGAACAAALVRENLRVTVVDDRPPGSGATAAGMGHITVMDDSPAQFALTNYSVKLWLDLASQLPRGAEFERRGTVWVAAGGDEMSSLCDKLAFYRGHGVRAELLDSHGLAEAEPNLRDGLAGGLLAPDDSVVYAPFIAGWLLRGTDLRRGRAVGVNGSSVKLDDGSELSAGAVVVAGGASASDIAGPLPIRPRKGHLAITDRYPGFVHHQLLELGYLKSAHGQDNESVAFNVQPRATGQVLIGSSRQYDITSLAVDSRFLARMLARAIEFMPALRSLNVIRTWTGLRAATPDSLPLIGPCPKRPGVWLATGHEGLGITTSLATAELIAGGILCRTPPIPAEPYLPERYAA